jgi:hypothetical protein
MPTPKGTKPWNAGTSKGWIDKRGYRWQYVTEYGKRVARREHRILMEAKLGRKLEPWELVHHINGNKSDNRPENLEVREFGEHTAEHHRGSQRREVTKRSIEAFALLREQFKREREIKAELLEALEEAFDFLGSVDDASIVRGKILAAIAKATQP